MLALECIKLDVIPDATSLALMFFRLFVEHLFNVTTNNSNGNAIFFWFYQAVYNVFQRFKICTYFIISEIIRRKHDV